MVAILCWSTARVCRSTADQPESGPSSLLKRSKAACKLLGEYFVRQIFLGDLYQLVEQQQFSRGQPALRTAGQAQEPVLHRLDIRTECRIAARSSRECQIVAKTPLPEVFGNGPPDERREPGRFVKPPGPVQAGQTADFGSRPGS